jgi:hypothetical protein
VHADELRKPDEFGRAKLGGFGVEVQADGIGQLLIGPDDESLCVRIVNVPFVAWVRAFCLEDASNEISLRLRFQTPNLKPSIKTPIRQGTKVRKRNLGPTIPHPSRGLGGRDMNGLADHSSNPILRFVMIHIRSFGPGLSFENIALPPPPKLAKKDLFLPDKGLRISKSILPTTAPAPKATMLLMMTCQEFVLVDIESEGTFCPTE